MRVVRRLWQEFENAAGNNKNRGPLDQRSFAVYLLLTAAFSIVGISLFLSDIIVSNNRLVHLFTMLFWMMICGLLAQKYGFVRIAAGLQCLAILPLLGAVGSVATVLLTKISLPFADDTLARIDAMLGFHWPTLFEIYQHSDELVVVSRWVYASLFWQFPILILLMLRSNDIGRLWVFLTAWALALTVTCLIYPLFPAAGPYVHFGITPEDIPNLGRSFPWTTAETISGIKSGQIRDLSKAMAGLVSFPSFHFAAAVLFMWASWTARWAAAIFVPLNIAMGFSTLVSGSHYLVDLIGGFLVAFGSLVLSKFLISRTGQ